jgi:hypothetical protein
MLADFVGPVKMPGLRRGARCLHRRRAQRTGALDSARGPDHTADDADAVARYHGRLVGGIAAAAQVHDAVRRDILAADARRIEATLNRDLVRPIVDLNLEPRARYPKITLALPSDTEVKAFADIVAELADRDLRIGQRAVLERLEMPEPAAGEPVLQAAARRN